MGFRELGFLARLFDREAAGAIGALQVLETVDGDARCARGELQEARFLLCIPAADDLWVGRVSEVVKRGVWLGLLMFAYLPEVLDHEITLGVAAVVGVFLPVVDVDVRDTTDEEFELALVEDVDEVCGDEFVEALHEGVELLLDTLLNAPLCDEPVYPLASMRSLVGTSKQSTYSTYSFLFSFVTSISLPPSFRSTTTFSPKRSSSTEKVE